jgi:hypothetical protein
MDATATPAPDAPGATPNGVSCREAGGGTEVSWVQTFEDAAVAARVRHVAEPANEENLDRLAAVLAGQAP